MTENPIDHDSRVKSSADDRSVHHVVDIDIVRKAEEAAEQRDKEEKKKRKRGKESARSHQAAWWEEKRPGYSSQAQERGCFD